MIVILPPLKYLANIKEFSGKAADVWALGVTVYCLIFNELAVWSDTEIGVLEAIHKTDLKLALTRNLSEGLKNLLLRMMEKDPSKRATLSELKQDKWLNEGFTVSLNSKEADFLANITEDEMKSKGIPLHAIVIAVRRLSFIVFRKN